MTNLEALKSVIGSNYPFDANVYEKCLIDQGLSSSETYTVVNARGIDLACSGLILSLITASDIREGGYQVTVADRNALLKLRSSLLSKYGIDDDGIGVVKDASNKW